MKTSYETLQIQHDQGEIFLVGGAYIAERVDMTMLMEFGHTLWQGEPGSVWSREDNDGGMIMGSAGAFLARPCAPFPGAASDLHASCRRQGARRSCGKPRCSHPLRRSFRDPRARARRLQIGAVQRHGLCAVT